MVEMQKWFRHLRLTFFSKETAFSNLRKKHYHRWLTGFLFCWAHGFCSLLRSGFSTLVFLPFALGIEFLAKKEIVVNKTSLSFESNKPEVNLQFVKFAKIVQHLEYSSVKTTKTLTDVLWRRRSWKFHKTHKKIYLPGSLFL